jgi:hypothetical protein
MVVVGFAESINDLSFSVSIDVFPRDQAQLG